MAKLISFFFGFVVVAVAVVVFKTMYCKYDVHTETYKHTHILLIEN